MNESMWSPQREQYPQQDGIKCYKCTGIRFYPKWVPVPLGYQDVNAKEALAIVPCVACNRQEPEKPKQEKKGLWGWLTE